MVYTHLYYVQAGVRILPIREILLGPLRICVVELAKGRSHILNPGHPTLPLQIKREIGRVHFA
jgi:hypothetical protein